MYEFAGDKDGQKDRSVREAFEEYTWVITELSPHTQVWYVGRLGYFVAWCEQKQLTVGSIRPMHVAMYLKGLREKISLKTGKPLSTYTLNGHGRAIRTFLYWCADEPQLYLWDAIPRHLTMPRIRKKTIQPFSQEQIQTLMVVAAQNIHSIMRARNQAVLAVLLDTGVRAEELCTLTLNHIYVENDEVYIKVIGKSFREREVRLGKLSRQLLMDYIKKYRPEDAGTTIVFLGHCHEPMTTTALRYEFIRWRERAQITDVRCSPHTCRHTFAINFLLQGGDTYILSRLLGHSSIKTTEIYLRAIEAIQARKQGHSVLDRLFGEEEQGSEAHSQKVEVEAFLLNGKHKEATQEAYIQWARFFCTWRERQKDAWLLTSEVVKLLSDVLPDSLQQQEEEHPQGFLLRIGKAFRHRFSVFYGEERIAIRSRTGPGQRGMKQWQVYHVVLPKQKPTN